MATTAQRSGLWRHPDFLKLWTGQTISLFGSLIGRFALPLVAIYTMDASPIQVATLGAANVAPGLALGLAQLYLVAVVTSALSILFEVAYRSYLPALVGRQHLVEGNSKLAAT